MNLTKESVTLQLHVVFILLLQAWHVEKLAAFNSSGILVFIFLAFALFKDSIIPKIKLNDWFSMTKNNLYLKHHALLSLDHLQ